MADTPEITSDTQRRAALTVAAHGRSAAERRELLAMLGLLPDTQTQQNPEAPSARPEGQEQESQKHGSQYRYRAGCRCRTCRSANTERCAEQRERRKADPSAADRAGHGKASTYKNYLCRCRPCAQANYAAVQAFRQRKAGAST